MESVGLGFAGVGLLGKMMIEHLPKVPSLRLAAVQDANPTLAAQVAKLYGSPWHGQQYGDLLLAPSVNAVVISTPNALHVPQAQAALRAGKQVLVQKPLAMSAAEARETVDLATASRRLLFVDYSYRLLETVATLKSTLPEIGPVRSVSTVFHNTHGPGGGRDWFLDPKLSGGGALVDLAVHLIDLILWVLAPREARLERSTLERRPGFQVEHSAQLELQLDDVPVQLAVSWHAPQPLTDIIVSLEGAHGSLKWHNVEGSFAHFQTELNERLLIDREIPLRENTLRAFAAALGSGTTPGIDLRVYDLLDRAYGRA